MRRPGGLFMLCKFARRYVITNLIAFSVFGGCSAELLPGQAPEPITIATLPLGLNGVGYEGINEAEVEPWGPSGLRVDNDGTLWLIDAAARRVIHFDRSGALLDVIPLDGMAVGPVDLYLHRSDLFLLDRAAMFPSVVRVSREGELVGMVALPAGLEASAQGFVANDDDRVLLSFGGTAVAEVLGNSGGLTIAAPEIYSREGRAIELSFPDATRDDEIGRELHVDIGNSQLAIRTQFFISSVALLAVKADGSFVLSMEEVTFDPVVLTDSTIWHVAADGAVLGKAREPVQAQRVFVPRGVALDREDALLALKTSFDGASVVELPWQSELVPVLGEMVDEERAFEVVETEQPAKAAVQTVGDVAVATQAATACVRREDMITRAFEYVNNWTWLSRKNVDRDNTRCAGRAVPRYFSTLKQAKAVNTPIGCVGSAPDIGYECIRSIPYDWGGWTTIANYARSMRTGAQAGDVDIAAIEGCSTGVDCSGLIGRLWRTNELPRADGQVVAARPTTRTLDKWSKAISAATGHPGCESCDNELVVLHQGDILLNPGVHVAMFRRFGETTIPEQKASGRFPFHLEATKGRGYDRAVYAAWPWTRYRSFQPRSFIHTCP
jgi:cell wall-associated NlpC family hydrolase